MNNWVSCSNFAHHETATNIGISNNKIVSGFDHPLGVPIGKKAENSRDINEIKAPVFAAKRCLDVAGPWLVVRSVTQECWASPAVTVFAISIATVIGPTPPGTGDNRDATCPTSGCTSPARRHPLSRVSSSTRLIPTSTTTAPGLIQSTLTISGLPTAAITMSAFKHSALASVVFE